MSKRNAAGEPVACARIAKPKGKCMSPKLPLLALGAAVLLSGCYAGHHRGYARGPDLQAQYSYVYYPDAEVYYHRHRHVYYWAERGAWRSGPRVPQHIVLRSHVTLSLNSPEPYRQHAEVKAKYPRPQRNEGRGRGRWDRDRR